MSDNKVIDCKMLVREVSNSRCFYVEEGNNHRVLLDTLDISADREAMEAELARLQRVEQERDALGEALRELATKLHKLAAALQEPK